MGFSLIGAELYALFSQCTGLNNYRWDEQYILGTNMLNSGMMLSFFRLRPICFKLTHDSTYGWTALPVIQLFGVGFADAISCKSHWHPLRKRSIGIQLVTLKKTSTKPTIVLTRCNGLLMYHLGFPISTPPPLLPTARNATVKWSSMDWCTCFV